MYFFEVGECIVFCFIALESPRVFEIFCVLFFFSK